MFTKRTVLVLGAGASCHYGYPTGEGLIDRILFSIKERNFHFLRRAEAKRLPLYKNDQQYTPLYDQLEFYDPLSIDSFLSQFSEKAMIDAGKAMIAYEILEAEDKRLFQRTSPLTVGKRNENWYRFLHHALTANAKPSQLIEDELKLHIVTFNYDNSLEYGFHSRFYNSPLLANKAAPFLEKISANIVHIYGQVGKFKWKGGTDRSDDDYGEYKADQALKLAEDKWKDTIFVIGQDRDDQVRKNADIARTWLKSAEVIFFLGFGFNDDNIQLLNLNEAAMDANQIYCTNHNNHQIINEKIKNIFNRNSIHAGLFNGQNKSYIARQAVISTKTVYEALAGDFNFIV